MNRSDEPMSVPPHDPRMKGFRARTGVVEVEALIDARIGPLDAEFVPLIRGAGRVLVDGVRVVDPFPPFPRAAMDGYAVKGAETFGSDPLTPATFRVIGDSRPGVGFAGRVGVGEAVRIMTGAPLPSGSDCVVKVESTVFEADRVQVSEPTAPGRHVGRIGEDLPTGQEIFAAGRRLRPQDLGVLSAMGRETIRVVQRPGVTIVVTGGELLPPGTPPTGFQIPDMNSVMLSALVERDGGVVRILGPVGDDRATIRASLIEASESTDCLLVSGGSSTGLEDHAPSLVGELGTLAVHGVALRPAGPTGLGWIGRTPVLLLPGNPVSCLCAYDFFGGRIIRLLGGRAPRWPYRPVERPLAVELVSILGRMDYTRVRLTGGGVEPIATGGASILSSTSRADGFVVVPADSEGFPAGEVVTVWQYDETASV
jgi:molybdopterin molybdotransferase